MSTMSVILIMVIELILLTWVLPSLRSSSSLCNCQSPVASPLHLCWQRLNYKKDKIICYIPFLSVVLGISDPSCVFILTLIDNVRKCFNLVHEILALDRDRPLCHLLHEVALSFIETGREWPPWNAPRSLWQCFEATYHGGPWSINRRA